MTNNSLKYLLFIVFSLSCISNQVVAQVSEPDSLALVALYNNTNGTSWTTDTNWLTAPVSTWYGVTVSGNRVTELQLPQNNLSGAIPAEIGNLTELHWLQLGENQLTSVPVAIGNLIKLTDLYLYNNPLTSVPAEIGSLSSLTSLYLSNTQLTTLPDEIGDLSSLQNLGLWYNQLNPIPTVIWTLTNLESLNIGGNQLTSIPSDIGSLTKLRDLNLDMNSLTSLPAELWTLTDLESLDVGRNQVESISHDIGNLSKLQRLDLRGSNLTTAPAELWTLLNLQELNLDQTQLSMLPAEIGDLIKLQYLDLYMNQLTSIPTTIGNLTLLQTLDIGNNQLTSIPTTIGNLTTLYRLELNNNQLTSVPIEISDITNLYTLDLDGNQLMTIPIEFWDLTSLTYFLVSYNKLTFEDIEPNIGIAPNFNYSPQDSVGTQVNVALNDGDPYTMSVSVGGSANQYQWKLNGVTIPGAISNSYTIVSASASDIGQYICEVSNTIATELIIYSRPVNVMLTGLEGFFLMEPQVDDLEYGNNNGIAEPGEHLTIYANIFNGTAINYTDVSTRADFNYDIYIDKTGGQWDDRWWHGDISRGQVVTESNIAYFMIDSDCPSGHTLVIPIHFTIDSGDTVNTDTLKIAVTGADVFPPYLLYASTPRTNYPIGAQVLITAKIEESGTITSFTADIESPDGFILETIDMYDDGNHGDDAAGDLLFGGYYYPDIEADFFVDFNINDEFANSAYYNNEINFSTYSLTNQILIVKDEVGYTGDIEYIDYYTNALDANGYLYDIWDTFTYGTPSASVLANYYEGVVIWYSGWQNPQLDSSERESIATYLDNGGKVFYNDQDLGYYVSTYGGTTWYNNYFHSTFIQDGTELYGILGVNGDAITDGMNLGLTNIYGGGTSWWPSEIDPIPPAESIFQYDPTATTPTVTLMQDTNIEQEKPLYSPNTKYLQDQEILDKKFSSNYGLNMIPLSVSSSGTAGIKVDTGTYKLVYLAFGFETISDEPSRAVLMDNIVKWLSDTSTGDCTSGSIIYNTATGKFNFCEDGVWVEK